LQIFTLVEPREGGGGGVKDLGLSVPLEFRITFFVQEFTCEFVGKALQGNNAVSPLARCTRCVCEDHSLAVEGLLEWRWRRVLFSEAWGYLRRWPASGERGWKKCTYSSL
ncbi:unnamed protein product, partial [Ectocarpus sp. 12 AP-2014]